MSCHYILIIMLILSLLFIIFFLKTTAPTEIYTLSLHDALPIWSRSASAEEHSKSRPSGRSRQKAASRLCRPTPAVSDRKSTRLNSSHQIISYAVFCLKKKKKSTTYNKSFHQSHYIHIHVER